MRDPLGNVPVRYKLALAFVGVCLLAFGVGGYLVSRSAMVTLEDEILARLRYQSEAYASALEGDLRALSQRARDFASDGLIRARFEALEEARGDERAALEAELRRHLLDNKLPLVPAFANLALQPRAGEPFCARSEDTGWTRHLVSGSGEREEFSLLLAPRREAAPCFLFATPLTTLAGERSLGRLVVEVNAAVWIAESLAVMRGVEPGEEQAPSLRLIDARGQVLVIPRSLTDPPRPAPTSELVRSGFGLRLEGPGDPGESPQSAAHGVFEQRMPIPSAGWTLETALDSRAALASISGLQARFLLVGAVLTLAASLVLVFPMRFLARPLAQLERAALKIRGGDFGARVEVETRDEIGRLSESFNLMAAAVEQRTGALEASAKALQQGQAELRAERDRLNAVISSMRDGLMVLDAEGRPLVWNTAARPLVEIAASGGLELSSHRLCQAALAAPVPHGGATSACHQCLFDPAAPPRSCLVDAGTSVWEVHSTRLAADASGRSGRVLVARDVSDRIAQDERQIHQERLAVLGEVAAVVAHELNNPLAAIRMFSQLLARNLPADSPLLEDVAVIERNIQACTRTIRDLLDYATGASPEVGELDVHATLEDVERFLRALRERKGAELELCLEAPDAVIRGDEVQVRQVFVNLILNALQAGAGVKVVVRTTLAENHLLVDVEDDGPGIPAERHEAIFRPFYTTKPRGEGTGLGLPTARRITEIQGGALELLSSVPGRTIFRVRLLRSAA